MKVVQHNAKYTTRYHVDMILSQIEALEGWRALKCTKAHPKKPKMHEKKHDLGWKIIGKNVMF